MSFSLEWRHRLDAWRRELPRSFFQELGEVALEGFTTTEQLTLGEALERPFAPMPPGTVWGPRWAYAWFRGELVLPEAARDQRVTLRLALGGDAVVFLNGVAVGACDGPHPDLTLIRSGVPGTRYEVAAEGYVGRGVSRSHFEACPPERTVDPDTAPLSATLGRSTYCLWHEVAYQLFMDVETLFQVREGIDPDSLRVAEIDAGLKDFCVLVDLELPLVERLKTFQAARERLRPLLACTNGSTAPTLYAFGHSHLDVAWKWPLEETERKCGRTFGTQLALMDEYPEFVFLQSQPHVYWMTQRRYPELYARIKQAARRGQFIPEGGMWVEADTNITGGESLIRQFVHGKRFFRDEFGVESELMWLPDVFGYSGALPQIMRGCGIKYFSTAKIFYAYNGGDPFPYNTFMWEGIDGSEILVHLTNEYNSNTDPRSVIERWSQRVQKDGISTRLLPFGHGDGGGGPTRDHLEFARRLANLEGAPKLLMATPNAYFHDQEARGLPSARYVGELYYQGHRGTYTSQARTKRGNRMAEFALRDAEIWAVAAQALAGRAYPLATFDGLWKKVLLNQFHDIIPGSSIGRVYQEAQADLAAVIEGATAIAQGARTALAALAQPAAAISVFNALSWERTALVALPACLAGACDLEGRLLPQQRIGDTTFVEARVPSCGWTALRASATATGTNAPCRGATDAHVGAASSAPTDHAPTECAVLENEHLRVTFNERGEITSIYDKDAALEVSDGVCNDLRMYKDTPGYWDAWDVDSLYPLTPVPLDEPAAVELLCAGPLVAQLRISRKLHDSHMTQTVSLRRGSRRVDLHTVIDWRERHKLLKVNFPVRIHANEGVHEIQFGHLRRPTHQSRPFDADRYEVSNHKWSALMEENRGVAVLNDCKYGVNIDGNSINLTLLKSAKAPDWNADQGHQEFTYAFYVWNGSFADCDLVREGYDLNAPVTTVEGDAGSRSLFSLDAPNIILDTVKAAEDGSGDVILRLYESKRMATRCTLTTTLRFAGVCETNMLEQAYATHGARELRIVPCGLAIEFRPFEIKTLRMTLA